MSDVRHVKTDSDRQVLSVGFEFFAPTKEQEKQLWEYVARDLNAKLPARLVKAMTAHRLLYLK